MTTRPGSERCCSSQSAVTSGPKFAELISGSLPARSVGGVEGDSEHAHQEGQDVRALLDVARHRTAVVPGVGAGSQQHRTRTALRLLQAGGELVGVTGRNPVI